MKIQRRKWMKLERGNYCIDGAANFPSKMLNFYNESFSGDYKDTIIVDCGPPIPTFKVTECVKKKYCNFQLKC